MSELEKLGEALERKGIEVDWVNDNQTDCFYLIANYTDVNGRNEKVDIRVEVDEVEGDYTSLSVEWYDYLRQAVERSMMSMAVHGKSQVKTVSELVEYIEAGRVGRFSSYARPNGMGIPIWSHNPDSFSHAVTLLEERVSIMEQDMEELVSEFRDFIRNDANERRIMRRSTPTRNRYRR